MHGVPQGLHIACMGCHNGHTGPACGATETTHGLHEVHQGPHIACIFRGAGLRGVPQGLHGVPGPPPQRPHRMGHHQGPHKSCMARAWDATGRQGLHGVPQRAHKVCMECCRGCTRPAWGATAQTRACMECYRGRTRLPFGATGATQGLHRLSQKPQKIPMRCNCHNNLGVMPTVALRPISINAAIN